MSRRRVLAAVLLLSALARAEAPPSTAAGAAGAAEDRRFAPYPDDGWNRLHQALFVRTAPADGARRVHGTDPLLWPGSTTFLFEGPSHREALARLDDALAAPVPAADSRAARLGRVFFQRDLWAAFDYAAWYPDDWVHQTRDEPAAIALRGRLAKMIGRLALPADQLAALPDNYAQAVAAKAFPPNHDPARPGRAFLPPDLFDPAGPWVRYAEGFGPTTTTPAHFESCGGRAAHLVFMRLPGGRADTLKYLSFENRAPGSPAPQFPPGTMVAMVRRALAVDAGNKVRATPVTELVQIRVYRSIPTYAGEDEERRHRGFAPGSMDAYEFVLDRAALAAGKPGLRPVGPDDPVEPFDRHYTDPFAPNLRPGGGGRGETQLASCTGCHQAPGVRSVLSLQRGLASGDAKPFGFYALDVDLSYTTKAKIARYDWGLLQGLLEAGRAYRVPLK